MTILERFMAFALGLPAERRAAIEERLAEIMGSEGVGEQGPEQPAEPNRRMADSKPLYATAEEVEAFFARYRTA
jgi:hypothetical protein